MAIYCQNCGLSVDYDVNYCPQCGAALTGGFANVNNGTGSGLSGAAKTAAVVGGALLGASALNNLARSMTHRRRPPYMGPMAFGGPAPGPRHPGPAPRRPGPGGPGHGPGGPGGRW